MTVKQENPIAHRLPPLVVLLRPHQWVKNAFVAAPLFFTPLALSGSLALRVFAGMLCFCAISSAIYVFNDYCDRESDRAHPTKCRRPLAAGQVSVKLALATGAGFLIVGLVGAFALTPVFAAVLLVYLVSNLAYSLALKQVAILDVMLIAFGFVLRVEGGASLADITPSAWIVVMTGLLALFLGLAKRRDDLVKKLDQDHRRSLDGYSIPFLDTALGILGGALLVAYLVYTTDADVMARLGTDKVFYTAPFVIFGILRYLQITLVEKRSGSPTTVVLTDRAILLAVIGWMATFGALIYS